MPNVFDHRRELYALRPDEFVEARTALAKRLRADGRKDDAAVVAKLRRPSVAAWALNQVARSAPDLVAAAIDAGAQLRAATEEAVAGNPGGLRAATAAERQAATAVVRASAEHLGSRADALAPVLLSTIRVAALDDEVADQLRQGLLVSEHDQPGFGFGLEEEVALAPATGRAKSEAHPAPEAGTTKRGATRGAKATPAGVAAGEAEARDQAEAERARQERAANREAEKARKRELSSRRRTADRKAREATRLGKEADQLELAARDARDAADQAAGAADEARRAVEELAGPG